MVRLNQLPAIQSQHIPRIPHELKARLPKELAIPLEEVKILVERMLRKTTANMGNMRGQVLRLLEREVNRNYKKWLTRQQTEEHISQSQASVRWSSFLILPMEVKRQRANQAREALGKQVIPWNFGLPASACETGYGQAQTMVGQTRRKKTRKRTQIERTMEDGTVEQLQSNHRPKNTDLTWDEFLHHGYALPFSNRRIDPLNQQRSNRWTIGNIPAYIRSDGIFPKMRSNVMELICRSQQAPWWPHGIYTGSVLTTLLSESGTSECLQGL
jgi:hypothetical protein